MSRRRRKDNTGPAPGFRSHTTTTDGSTDQGQFSREFIKMLLHTCMIFLAIQSAALYSLSRSFRAVPSLSRAIREVVLIPLLPLARQNGRFRFEVFKRKWLYWALTRARRLLVPATTQVLLVDIKDGSSNLVPVSQLAPKCDNCVRYVAISDTHLLHRDVYLPDADVLIHCGDVLVEDRYDQDEVDSKPRKTTNESRQRSSWKLLLEDFDDWLATHASDYAYKFVTGGNHDQIFQVLGQQRVQSLLPHATYLNDALAQVMLPRANTSQHHRVYISAASRGYTQSKGGNVAFQYTGDEDAERIWSQIPSNIDVLVTHGPPRGIFDGPTANTEGCPTLLEHVQTRVKPKVHVFGHWHDATHPAAKKIDDTVFINAAITDFDYAASHPVVVFDLPIY